MRIDGLRFGGKRVAGVKVWISCRIFSVYDVWCGFVGGSGARGPHTLRLGGLTWGLRLSLVEVGHDAVGY